MTTLNSPARRLSANKKPDTKENGETFFACSRETPAGALWMKINLAKNLFYSQRHYRLIKSIMQNSFNHTLYNDEILPPITRNRANSIRRAVIDC